MLNALKRINLSSNLLFILISGIFFFLLRLPSIFEPYWYGDEGIYEVIGFALRHGRLLYRDIWDNKPPLLYLVYALFNGSQPEVKFFSFLVGLVAVIFFFILAKKLIKSNAGTYLATLVFTFLLGAPFLEGNIANAENFMVLPTIVSTLLILKVIFDKKSFSNYTLLLFSGLCVGLSFLFKVVGIFDAAAFGVFLIIVLNTNRLAIRQTVISLTTFGIGFILPLLITIVFFASQHALPIFIQSTFLSNISYVAYGNNQVLPHYFIYLKLLALAAVLGFVFLRRRNLSTATIFITIWLSFSVFNALFSQRPYTHYLLVLIPSFSLLLGSIFAKRKFHIVAFILTLAVLYYIGRTFTFYDKTLAYYENFISYATGAKDETSYQSFFDRVTPRDYEIAQYLESKGAKGKNVYIWGNSGQIYRLTDTLPPGRFIVAYHVTMTSANYTETMNALQKASPNFIIVLPNQGNFAYPMNNYSEGLIIDNAIIYEKIF